jgi:hypothetical protein
MKSGHWILKKNILPMVSSIIKSLHHQITDSNNLGFLIWGFRFGIWDLKR